MTDLDDLHLLNRSTRPDPAHFRCAVCGGCSSKHRNTPCSFLYRCGNPLGHRAQAVARSRADARLAVAEAPENVAAQPGESK